MGEAVKQPGRVLGGPSGLGPLSERNGKEAFRRPVDGALSPRGWTRWALAGRLLGEQLLEPAGCSLTRPGRSGLQRGRARHPAPPPAALSWQQIAQTPQLILNLPGF